VKLSHKNRPKRKTKKHGNYVAIRKIKEHNCKCANLAELSPVQVMPGIKLENEDIIDL
jgi:hypothetical protein